MSSSLFMSAFPLEQHTLSPWWSNLYSPAIQDPNLSLFYYQKDNNSRAATYDTFSSFFSQPIAQDSKDVYNGHKTSFPISIPNEVPIIERHETPSPPSFPFGNGEVTQQIWTDGQEDQQVDDLDFKNDALSKEIFKQLKEKEKVILFNGISYLKLGRFNGCCCLCSTILESHSSSCTLEDLP